MNVYLAGGMRSGWQDTLKKEVPNLTYFDPRIKEIDKKMSLTEYGTWDLHYIKMSDVVFVYYESSNPSGIGLSVEAGYAKGIGKTVVLVLEENNKHQKYRYIQFLKKVADVVYNNFDDAMDYMRTFSSQLSRNT